ncbi:TetR/AcrR family transcriptional regulator [Streptomyces sp. NPDC058122]|uniref:TetR/AcrR family transcriptional regulator n=1 Tax=Streptomyces sp. NPDC058122 TaxID=3346349 RepID=UPI0036F13EB5
MSKQPRATQGVGTKGMPRKDRERLILEAAAEEFGVKGYARGSTAHVAERAGITKPMIYEYFGSKDSLYLTCLDQAGTRLVEAVGAAQRGRSDLSRAVRTLEAVFRALESRLHDWELVYDGTLPAEGPLQDAAAVYRRELNRMGAVGVSEFLHTSPAVEPLDADLVTHLWYGTVSAAVAWWRHHPEQTADEMAARFERIVAVLCPDLWATSDATGGASGMKGGSSGMPGGPSDNGPA